MESRGPGREPSRGWLTPEEHQEAIDLTLELLTEVGMTIEEAARFSGYKSLEKILRATGGREGFAHDKLVRLIKELVRRKVPPSRAAQLLTAWKVGKRDEMTLEYVIGEFRRLDFSGDGLRHPAQRPDAVLWLHKLRSPNIVHGVLALAAAALIRAGLDVRLLLDDTEAGSEADGMADHFRSDVDRWLMWASAPADRLVVQRFSDVLPGETIGIDRVNAYLSHKATILQLLDSAKVFPPLHETAEYRQRVKHAHEQKASKLRTPFRNWLVADAQVATLATGARKPVIATLGGKDEQALWTVWRHCSPSDHGPVKNIFIDVFPAPLMDSDMTMADREGFQPAEFADLIKSGENADKQFEWVQKFAIGLPASLNPAFRGTLSEDLKDVDACRSAWQAQPGLVATKMARAVREWFR